MSGETRDVEVLADWMLQHADKAFPWPGELEELMADDLARAILASDWLAEHDAEVEARVREQIAQAIETSRHGKRDHVVSHYEAGQWDGLSNAACIARGGAR